MRQPDRKKTLTDIHIVHTDSEWQMARAIARLLDARGYAVAPSRTLELPNRLAVDTLPADAGAVLVIWPMKRALFDKPALEARAAARDNRLVQIYAGDARPDERYGGAPAVDFSGWDFTASGDEWRALLRRLSRLCGSPPKRDAAATTESVVLYSTLVLAVGSIAAVFFEIGHKDALKAATPAPRIESAAHDAIVPSAIVAPPRAVRIDDDEAETAPEVGLGGPEDYDTDLGVEFSAAAPSPAPEPPEPVKRAPQNPPSALE